MDVFTIQYNKISNALLADGYQSTTRTDHQIQQWLVSEVITPLLLFCHSTQLRERVQFKQLSTEKQSDWEPTGGKILDWDGAVASIEIQYYYSPRYSVSKY